MKWKIPDCPHIVDGRAPACPRNIWKSSRINLVGGWEQATIPTPSLAGRQATEWQSALAAVFFWLTTSIFPNFAKSYFSTLSTYIAQHCILMLNGAISYFLAPVFHTFLSHHCCSAAHWQSMCGGTEVQKNVILTKIRPALLYFYPYSIYFLSMVDAVEVLSNCALSE